VGGPTAGSIDFTSVLSSKLPVFIAVVVGLAALLLLVVFRSLVIPVQAAVMNLLSIGAALGLRPAAGADGASPGRRPDEGGVSVRRPRPSCQSVSV
jgi:putative drug exporter of the RND superfamily